MPLVRIDGVFGLFPILYVVFSPGVFLVTTENAILPVDRDYSVNTFS